MISDISAHRTTVFQHTRSLKVNMDRSSFTDDDMLAWKKLWSTFLTAMRSLSSLKLQVASDGMGRNRAEHMNNVIRLDRLRGAPTTSIISPTPLRTSYVSLSWDFRESLNPELTAEVSSLLGRCSNLERVFFGMMARHQMKWILNPQPFATLIESWSLLEWSLKLRELVTRGVTVSPEDLISNIRHLRSLKDLTIVSYHTLADPGKSFDVLRKEDIHLGTISIPALHPPEIIEYISSFTGLEGFSIKSYDTRDDTQPLIHQLFSALQRHCITLRSLTIYVYRISPWQEISRNHFSESAELFQSLEELDVHEYISAEDVRVNNAEPLLAWL
ncbi:hypothetical protein D9756_009394 [Leucocoprinus leucothites]|uniref:Uncharacterized protein n=1 Tax=Leucocoprinus leucothites TaxID=201217 RepID=A0A8H5CYZ5_9AGAR|nr:hypothetical protein D9756_009394 [Leucoagaricus leucothites]